MRSLLWGFGAIGVLVACGGTTVIDGGSGGTGGQGTTSNGTAAAGASSTTSTSSSMNSTTASGPADCGTLGTAMLNGLDAAMRCDTCNDGPDPCEYLSGQQLTDTCGCPVPVNSSNPDAVAAALAAYQAWTTAGCGPLNCGQPCAVSSDPTCSPLGPGCDGFCAP